VPVQSAFEPVLFAVCGLGLLAALLAILTTNKTWEEYGKSRLLMDHDASQPAVLGAAALLERDIEIRQLLEARNQRRERRGEPLVDVERELQRLTALQVDSQLQTEIRELVVARNHRRVRAGKAPLDVEAEVSREIAQLTMLEEG
jgi:hypothetical protein